MPRKWTEEEKAKARETKLKGLRSPSTTKAALKRAEDIELERLKEETRLGISKADKAIDLLIAHSFSIACAIDDEAGAPGPDWDAVTGLPLDPAIPSESATAFQARIRAENDRILRKMAIDSPESVSETSGKGEQKA